MSYHCTVHVLYESDDEKYTIPEHFEIGEMTCNGSSRVEIYVSKKYNSLEEMLPDYHHALVVSKQEARADLYYNNRLLPESIYKDYLKKLKICHVCGENTVPGSSKCSKCSQGCPYCPEYFLQLDGVLNHIRIQHSEELNKLIIHGLVKKCE